MKKREYRNYFVSLGDVLPCRHCRDSYKKFISNGDTALTDDVLKNRESLTRWFYRVHNAVNDKLEMKYSVTYEDLVNRYESFRAKCEKPKSTDKGCTVPLDYKAFSFKKLYYMDAPIVPLETVYSFVLLAKKRGLDNRYYEFIKLAELLNGDFSKMKTLTCWENRNNYCQYQIKFMRKNGLPSIEEEGEWKGTPTLDELKLLMFLSSNLMI